jgi:hypothetical protein
MTGGAQRVSVCIPPGSSTVTRMPRGPTSRASTLENPPTAQGPLPDLGASERRELVSTVALLAGAMYRIATPPPPLAELYATEPQLGHALLDLEGRLTRAAQVTIAGLGATAQVS